MSAQVAPTYDARARKWCVPRALIPAGRLVAERAVAESVSQPPHMDGLCSVIDGPEMRGGVVTFVGPGKAFCDIRTDYSPRTARFDRSGAGEYLNADGWRAQFAAALSNVLDYKRYFSLAELRAGPVIAFDVRDVLPPDWDVDARPSKAVH